MENTTRATIDCIPYALGRVYDQLDEMRILVMLEESEREAAAGNTIPLEEGFAMLRARMKNRQDKKAQLHEQDDSDDSGFEVRANAV